MTSDDYKAILREKKLPVPPGEIRKLRYRLYNEDWWALTEDGWLWLDFRPDVEPKVWKPSRYGPD